MTETTQEERDEIEDRLLGYAGIRELPARWNDEGLSVDGATSEFNHGYKAAKYEDADALAKAIASAPADGWWKKGDHVEFVTDEIIDKGPCTGKIRWVLDGLACIELADDFVHLRWSEIGNFRMTRHHRTGWPLWIVGESAAAPQRGGEHES